MQQNKIICYYIGELIKCISYLDYSNIITTNANATSSEFLLFENNILEVKLSKYLLGLYFRWL